MICELCEKKAMKLKTLCITHQQELEYHAAHEYSLPFVPTFVKKEYIEKKRRELFG